MITELYRDQVRRWPADGRHILAQFTEDTIVVYQAYRPGIASYALANQRFGGDFSFGRMSWIKPNFLWMMYRSGWGTKEGQEVVLALHVSRAAFDSILKSAVDSTFQTDRHISREAWKEALARSEVRLQWDPDHAPGGGPVSRRAVQLGLRGAMLRSLATEWLIRIEDVSGFVAQQRHVLSTQPDLLVTPCERVFPLSRELAQHIGADTLA